MGFWEIVILSIIQGITEFLPVSSKSHLAIAEHLFGLANPETNLVLIVMFHFASLVAIIICFYEEIIEMFFKPQILLLVIIGTIPAGLVGYLFEHTISQLLSNMWVIGIGFMVSGTYMILSEMHWKSSPLTLERAGWKQALWVGLGQAAAILPGISRSGSTIASGLFSGLEKTSAIKFSFLLAIPIIGGASILKLKDFGKLPVAFQPIHIIVGFIICLGVSLLAISILVRTVRRGHLAYFGWYCLLAGLATIIFKVAGY